MTKKKLKAVHPGEILQYEFIEPFGLNQNKLAQAIHVPARRINEIVLKKRSITADTALRLRVHSKITSALMRHYNITFIQSSIAKSSE